MAGKLDAKGIPAIRRRGVDQSDILGTRRICVHPEGGDSNVRLQKDIAGIHFGMQYSF
jgi:hypothetical protein